MPDAKYINDFVTAELRPKVGRHISSTILYERYRQWYRNTNGFSTDISDVKLAEAFSTHLSNKRVAAGRVWLDHELVHQVWSGPSAYAPLEILLSLEAGENLVCTKLFGHIYKDLTITIPQESRGRITLSVSGHRYEGLFESGKPMLPGLWLMNTIYSDINLHIAIDRPCIVTCSVVSCTDVVPSDAQYSNETKQAIFRVANGLCSLTTSPQLFSMTREEILATSLEGMPEKITVGPYLCHRYPEQSIVGPDVLVAGMVSVLHADGGEKVSLVEVPKARPTVTYTRYICKEAGGYRYYMEAKILRSFEIIHNVRLCGLSIPSELIRASLAGTPYESHQYLKLNSSEGFCLLYWTSYLVPDLPASYASHAFQGCYLVADVIMTDLEIINRDKVIHSNRLEDCLLPAEEVSYRQTSCLHHINTSTHTTKNIPC